MSKLFKINIKLKLKLKLKIINSILINKIRKRTLKKKSGK